MTPQPPKADIEARSREECKVNQTAFGPKGNCQSACLAMVLGVPISSVPNFFDGLELDDPELSEKWNQAERKWLESLGWASITLNVEGGYFEKHFSKGFVIASGQSTRGLSHAVVYKDGSLWHDPYPGGEGVGTVREVEVVYPLIPFSIMSLQSSKESLSNHLTGAQAEIERLTVQAAGYALERESLRAEVELLSGIVSEVHSMTVQANARGETIQTKFILSAINEKARQPNEVERLREIIPPGYDLDFIASQIPKMDSALHRAHEGKGGGASIPCCPNHACLYKVQEIVLKMMKIEKARQPK